MEKKDSHRLIVLNTISTVALVIIAFFSVLVYRAAEETRGNTNALLVYASCDERVTYADDRAEWPVHCRDKVKK